jgi:hypothetical protein
VVGASAFTGVAILLPLLVHILDTSHRAAQPARRLAVIDQYKTPIMQGLAGHRSDQSSSRARSCNIIATLRAGTKLSHLCNFWIIHRPVRRAGKHAAPTHAPRLRRHWSAIKTQGRRFRRHPRVNLEVGLDLHAQA